VSKQLYALAGSAGRCGAAWTQRSGAVGPGRWERRWVPKGASVPVASAPRRTVAR